MTSPLTNYDLSYQTGGYGCKRCGAIVPILSTTLHDAWHESVAPGGDGLSHSAPTDARDQPEILPVVAEGNTQS